MKCSYYTKNKKTSKIPPADVDMSLCDDGVRSSKLMKCGLHLSVAFDSIAECPSLRAMPSAFMHMVSTETVAIALRLGLVPEKPALQARFCFTQSMP